MVFSSLKLSTNSFPHYSTCNGFPIFPPYKTEGFCNKVNNVFSMSHSKIVKFPCILQCDEPCSSKDSLDRITEERWKSIKEKALRWKGLDRFGDVYDKVKWENGPAGLYMHQSCVWTLTSKDKLSRSMKRKQESQDIEDKHTASVANPECSSAKKLRSSTGVLHYKDKCVFCMTGKSKKKGEKYILSLLCTEQAWEKFKNCPSHINDKAVQERISMLVSSISDFETAVGLEIRYHPKCYRLHVPIEKNLEHTTDVGVNVQQELQRSFFELVQQVIFVDHEFRSLQSLLRDYTKIKDNYGQESTVKSSYIKTILKQEFGDMIGFYERPNANQSDIVYDKTTAGSYVEAAILSLGVSVEELLKNVAKRLHENIMNTEVISWPPLISDLEEPEKSNPLLMKLITLIRDPNKKDLDDSPRVKVLTSLLTYYTTGKRTNFAINYSTWLHGLTKSREAVDVSHKDGIGIAYNDIMMLRDLWAYNDLSQSLNCPVELAEGEPAVCIIDNDNFRMDTLTGAAPQANRTNVMFIQPECLKKQVQPADIPDKRASCLSASLKELNKTMKDVTPYKTRRNSEPPVRTKPLFEEKLHTLKQRTRSVIHALSRADNYQCRPDVQDQKVPSFSGFQARMSQPVQKSTPIFHTSYPENPNKSIVNDCMDKLTKAIEEKKMPFAVMVGDHPVYMLMLDLKSENAEKYFKILPFLDPFHIEMSFIYCIYKRFQGSGIDDVLVAAGVISEGSCDKALRGKHFNRGVRCLRLFYEALIHYALNHRLEGTVLSEDIKLTLDQLREINDAAELRKAYNELESNLYIKHLVETLLRDSSDSDHASLFVSFMEMVEILTQNIHSLRTQNWSEFKSSLKLMCPWLKAYDNNNYSRALPDFCAVLYSLPKEQEDFFEKGMFAQSMTGNPYSCVALQIWIESTMNKGSKLKNGWKAILNNEKQIASNVCNANNINRIRGIVLNQANQKKRKTKHIDCSKSRISKDEQALQNICDCFNEFGTNPFDQSNTQLRSLQSGIPASKALVNDFKTAKSDGEKWVKDFSERCIYSKQGSLKERIPQSKRLNFAKQNLNVDGGVENKRKASDMERIGLSQVVELVQASGSLELESILQNRITQENLSIFNVNGSMRKCQKSMLISSLSLIEKDEPNNYTAEVDMGLIWRLATPTTEDREKADGSVYTWGDFGKKVFNIIKSRHEMAERIICVNDSYSLRYSIKDSERTLRIGSKPVKNVFMKSDQHFPSNKEFHALLSKSENKIRLQKFLEAVFQVDARSSEIEIIYVVVGEYAKNLSRETPEPDMLCLHAEADTAIFTIYDSLRKSGYVNPIVIDSDDTDNYIQAAYVSNKVQGIMLLKRKNKYVDAQTLCQENDVDSIIPLHILTGSDHTSAFYGVSKRTVAERVKKSEEAKYLLASCGTNANLTDEIKDNMTKFTIKYVYNDKNSSTPSEARAIKWKQQKKKSLIRMIPDNDSLLHHFKRVNYICYIQKNFHLKEHPSPLLHGWHLENGLCLPIRHSIPALPRTMPEREQGSSSVESSSETDSSDDFSTSNDESCSSQDYNSNSD